MLSFVTIVVDRRRSNLYVAYLTGHTRFEFHKIANLERLVQQQHNPRNEITEECLQPEAEADSKGAAMKALPGCVMGHFEANFSAGPSVILLVEQSGPSPPRNRVPD